MSDSKKQEQKKKPIDKIIDKINKLKDLDIIKEIGDNLSIKTKNEKGEKEYVYNIEDNIYNVIKNIIGIVILLFSLYLINNDKYLLGLLICVISIIMLSYNSYWKIIN
jgi:ABC-type bacteriocin/lantibiotic exporter with double-glycine peptidase domain